ncbi:MAG: hypothetical protein KGQ59_10645, partial [Bdellovibrionales bacterium]|nr:hypothetical protein [Bdellovibrionales bacterium]
PWIGSPTLPFTFENIISDGNFSRSPAQLSEGQVVRNARIASVREVSSSDGVLTVVDGVIHGSQEYEKNACFEGIPLVDEPVIAGWTSASERGSLSSHGGLDRGLQIVFEFLGIRIRRRRHIQLERVGPLLGIQVRSEQFLELPWGIHQWSSEERRNLWIGEPPEKASRIHINN